MNDLRTVAQQALEALQNCANGEDDVLLTRDALAALRTALAEPVQEPDSPERRCGGPGCDMKCCQPVQQGCDHCNHPLYAAIKCRVCGRVTEPTPLQRKPLSEEEIAKCWHDTPWNADLKTRVFAFARAVERAHGIGGEG